MSAAQVAINTALYYSMSHRNTLDPTSAKLFLAIVLGTILIEIIVIYLISK